MKKCSRCDTLKDETQFSRDKNRVSGLKPSCKQCDKKISKKYNNHPVSVTSKACVICLQIKTAMYFNRDKTSSDGLRGDCKSCFGIKKAARLNSVKIRQHHEKYRFHTSKSNAKRRGIEWQLSQQEYYHLTDNASCHYCCGKLSMTGSRLDRKDNNVGYVLHNVVPCCTRCNTIKSNYFSFDEMTILSPALKSIASSRQSGGG